MESINSVIQASMDNLSDEEFQKRLAGLPANPIGHVKMPYIGYLATRFFMKTVPECERILSKDKFIVWYLVTMNDDWSTDIKVKFSDGEDVNFSILPTRM